MIPEIQETSFGSITIAGQVYNSDILIRLDGQIEKRRKKLSKAIYGTSHMISRDEAVNIHQEGAERLLIGTGQFGMVKLSEEADEFFKNKNCQVELLSTPEALKAWNRAEGAVIAMFHLTC